MEGNKNYRLKAIAATILFNIFGIASTQAQLRINEVQYSNRQTITDATGDTPDWIELYNAGPDAINLKDYALSDNNTGKDKWLFPAKKIEAGAYILIFASGANRKTDNELHCSFKLSNLEEPVCLFSKNGTLLQTIAPRCVPADKSLGFTAGGSQLAVLSPTPGKSNNGAQVFNIQYQKDSITTSHSSGFYQHDISLQLKKRHPENEIRYTVNADEPDDRSLLYKESILLTDINKSKNRFANKGDADYKPGNLIAKGNIIRAQVYSAGCPASEEIVLSYFINSSKPFDYNVPIISLVSDKNNLWDRDKGIAVYGNNANYTQHGKAWERPVHVQVFDKGKQKVVDQTAGMRIHGRGSRAGDQKSFRLYARNKYGKEAFNYPFFSQKPQLDSFKTVLLRTTNEWTGTSFKDELCQHLVQDMDIDYTAAETCVVFLNGEYWGLYSLRERQDEDYIANNYSIPSPEINVVAHDLDKGLVAEKGDLSSYNQLADFLKNTSPEASNYYDKLGNYIDINAFIDYYIAQIYLANTDFPNNNVELWKADADTSVWRPFFFDLDGAMFRANYELLAEYTANENGGNYPDYATLLLRKALQNKNFQQQFKLKFIAALNSYFAPEKVIQLIDEYEALYSPLIREHIYRWGDPVDENTWKRNVDMLRTFAIERPAEMNRQISDKLGTPAFIYPNPSQGQVTIDITEGLSGRIKLSNSSGLIIYDEPFNSSGKTQVQYTLSSGVYAVQIELQNSRFIQPLIVR